MKVISVFCFNRVNVYDTITSNISELINFSKYHQSNSFKTEKINGVSYHGRLNRYSILIDIKRK